MSKTTTTDALFGGAVVFVQPASGYRVNIDAILLARFAHAGGRARRVVDLGAGVGAVTLALAHLTTIERVDCVDRERTLVTLCRKNLARAGIDGAAHVADLANGLPQELARSADLVVANPPFFEAGERRAASAGRESARAGELTPFLRAARAGLGRRRPRAVFVYPARSLARLLALGEECGLVAKRLRLVHARPDEPARVALVELKPAKPGGLVVEPPLIEWSARGKPSAELRALTNGRASDRR